MPDEKRGGARIHRPYGWRSDHNEVEVPSADDESCLPLWHGDPSKDDVTAEQWIERIQGAKDICKWTDDFTMSNIFKALKGKALSWFIIVKRANKDSIPWLEFKKAFVNHFTVHAKPMVRFSDLVQFEEEKVIEFYERVVKAMEDLESLVPNRSFELPNPHYPKSLTSVTAFAGLSTKNKRNAAQRLVRHGAICAFNFVGLYLFLGGVRVSIQEELLKSTPRTLYSALEAAQVYEKVEAEKKPKKVPAVIPKAKPTKQSYAFVPTRAPAPGPVPVRTSAPVPMRASAQAPPAPVSVRAFASIPVRAQPREPLVEPDDMDYEESIEDEMDFIEEDDDDEDYCDQSYESESDDDDSYSEDTMNPRVMLEDIGLDDEELMRISTKDLNTLLKRRKIDKERQKEVKNRRRTLKNRGYAASCRTRRDETEETIRKEILDLNVKVAEKIVQIENCKKETQGYVESLKSNGFSDDMISQICNSEYEAVDNFVMEIGTKLTH